VARVSGARGHRSFWRNGAPSLSLLLSLPHLFPLEVVCLEVGPLNPARGSLSSLFHGLDLEVSLSCGFMSSKIKYKTINAAII